MVKNRIALHIIAISSLLLFCFLAVGSGATTPAVTTPAVTQTGEETIVSSETISKGLVHNMSDPEGKAYTTLGLVFASSETKYDEKGKEIASQEGIATMLLRKAHELGGDDILNLRVDENTTYIEKTITVPSTSADGSSSSKTTAIKLKTVTYTGSALAIKYSNNEEAVKGNSLFGGKFVPGRITVEGTAKE
jgi:hypothetical protein